MLDADSVSAQKELLRHFIDQQIARSERTLAAKKRQLTELQSEIAAMELEIEEQKEMRDRFQ